MFTPLLISRAREFVPAKTIRLFGRVLCSTKFIFGPQGNNKDENLRGCDKGLVAIYLHVVFLTKQDQPFLAD